MSAEANAMAFVVICRCGNNRGFLPSSRYDEHMTPGGAILGMLSGGGVPVWAGVLICPRCDYDHDGASVIPREHAIRDIGARP